MLRIAADFLDIIQDGDDLPGNINNPADILGFANGLIFAAFNEITMMHDMKSVQLVSTLFSRTAFQSAIGADLSLKIKRKNDSTLESYWQATILKSGSIFKAGLCGGAMVGENPSDAYIAKIGDFGTALGVIRQIIDDCRDVLEETKLSAYEVTLPLLLLAEKQGRSLSEIMQEYRTKEALTSGLITADVPEIIASVLLEWRHRAMSSLKNLECTEAVNALETVVQEFITHPW
jgi:geranylgeranyl pyrophosphate synthase